jgi:hypothetical protein
MKPYSRLIGAFLATLSPFCVSPAWAGGEGGTDVGRGGDNYSLEFVQVATEIGQRLDDIDNSKCRAELALSAQEWNERIADTYVISTDRSLTLDGRTVSFKNFPGVYRDGAKRIQLNENAVVAVPPAPAGTGFANLIVVNRHAWERLARPNMTEKREQMVAHEFFGVAGKADPAPALANSARFMGVVDRSSCHVQPESDRPITLLHIASEGGVDNGWDTDTYAAPGFSIDKVAADTIYLDIGSDPDAVCRLLNGDRRVGAYPGSVVRADLTAVDLRYEVKGKAVLVKRDGSTEITDGSRGKIGAIRCFKDNGLDYLENRQQRVERYADEIEVMLALRSLTPKQAELLESLRRDAYALYAIDADLQCAIDHTRDLMLDPANRKALGSLYPKLIDYSVDLLTPGGGLHIAQDRRFTAKYPAPWGVAFQNMWSFNWSLSQSAVAPGLYHQYFGTALDNHPGYRDLFEMPRADGQAREDESVNYDVPVCGRR